MQTATGADGPHPAASAAPVQVPPEVYSIPIDPTLSEEATGVLGFFSSFGKKMFTGMPPHDDHAAWAERFEANQLELQGMNDQVQTAYPSTMIEATIGGTPVLDIKPDGWEDNGKVAVYVHGGAFTHNSAETQLYGSHPFAQESGLRVISIDYTVAPVATHEEILAQVISVLTGLQGEGYEYSMENMVVYGDSAGGGLATGALLKMQAEGLEMPAALGLISPWLDLTGEGESYTENDAIDPILTYNGELENAALAYVGGDEALLRNPNVSPLFAENIGPNFPRTFIQGGTLEILSSDFTRFHEMLKHADINTKLVISPGLWHTAPLFAYDLPESKAIRSQMIQFLVGGTQPEE